MTTGPQYAAAATELLTGPTHVVVDLGCGTGRALPRSDTSAGPHATIIGVDVTPEMLAAAAAADREGAGALVLADVDALPFAARSVDAFFAAGLLGHVPDPARLLRTVASLAPGRPTRGVPSDRAGRTRGAPPTDAAAGRVARSFGPARRARGGGLDDRDPRRWRIALPRDRGVALSRYRDRAASSCSSTSSRSRAIGTGGSPARCARTR